MTTFCGWTSKPYTGGQIGHTDRLGQNHPIIPGAGRRNKQILNATELQSRDDNLLWMDIQTIYRGSAHMQADRMPLLEECVRSAAAIRTVLRTDNHNSRCRSTRSAVRDVRQTLHSRRQM